jgi:hypothetical protein
MKLAASHGGGVAVRLGTVRAHPLKTALVALLWIVIGIEVMRLVTIAVDANFADLQSYQRGAKAILTGASPYADWQLSGPYPLDAAVRGRGFVYPPTAGFLLLPLLVPAIAVAFGLLSALAFVVIGALIVRRALGPDAALVAAALLLAQPGLHEIHEGASSMLVAAGVGLMWLRPRWSGWLGVAGGLLKIYPALGLLWAWRMRASILPPLAVGLVLAALVATSWLPWFTAMRNAQPGCPAYGLPSFGCAGVAWLGYLLAAGLALAMWRIRDDATAFAVLGIAMVVAAPDLYWGYLLVPTMAFIPLLCAATRRLQSMSTTVVKP